MLAEYKQYLQSCYKARVLAPADKYLPTLKSPYINLAMIRRGHYNSEQRDEFTKRTLHGGVDQILENKTPINIEDLLTPENDESYFTRVKGGDWLVHNPWESEFLMSVDNREGLLDPEDSDPLPPSPKVSKKPLRFILVEGPPGIGKSTFAWEVCRRWDEIESLRDYHIVVLLKLREKWVLNATSLSDLLRFPSHPDFSKSIAKELVKSQGKKLLFVLDGFDEVSHSFHKNSVIKSILCRELLPECTIILTTRPVAMYTLRSICQPQVDKHVEIIGFTEEERVRYITEVFSKEPELQVNFLKYMFLVPHIKSMMYIPLNCAIIAQVYYESQRDCNLTIPKTRTQLYKALTHSLLVRHLIMKGKHHEYTSMLPEGLSMDYMNKFKRLARFAFDSYHQGESRKVTFFEEDILNKGLVHFGFMNESTEMYAGTGVEQTFSFLHLSLQEYLAAWHLADSYSIEFQVAYHWLATDSPIPHDSKKMAERYKGINKKRKALISSLERQRSSLREPAIFLAGITGWRCHSKARCNWETYLNLGTKDVKDHSVLLQSLYEAQNPTLLPHYYAVQKSDNRRKISIGSFKSSAQQVAIHTRYDGESSAQQLAIHTPYDCYALSYCLAHSSDQFSLSIGISTDDEVVLVETFVKGLKDHCKSTTPRVTKLKLRQTTLSVKNVNNCLFWLTQANCLAEVEEMKFGSTSSVSCDLAYTCLKKLVKLQFIFIHIPSWQWLPALKSLSGRELKGFHITNVSRQPQKQTSLSSEAVLEVDRSWDEAILDIKFPSSTISYDVYHSVNVGIDSLLKCIQGSKQITMMDLSNISRETMAGVHNILLYCPGLTTLELKRTRLGYDGILYICSALRYNTTLSHLVIHDDFKLPPLRKESKTQFTSLSFRDIVPLPGKTTCTDFLLEINNILKDNTTLEEMKIQSGLFLPLSAGGYRQYDQWTGLGPLQQFNMGAVGSGMSPNLRRSFSSSDLTQPQTTLFWDRLLRSHSLVPQVNFKRLFSKRKEERKKLFSLPSFTAPDTEVLQSFSGLDPRLKECLEISHLHQYVERLKETYIGILRELVSK